MSGYNAAQRNVYSISQNFITSKRLLERITALSTIQANDTVIEIGTGKGHLAHILAQKCKTLYTTEIDGRLFRQAQHRLAALSNVRLTHGDFLRSALPKRQPYKVFANLPFSGTSQIIHKLVSSTNPPSDMWLVMEKGTAKRYLGKPGENLQSLLLKPRWQMRIVYHFRQEDFHPCPSVESVLVHFSRKQIADVPPSQWDGYTHFVRHILRYGLSGSGRLLTKKQISQAFKHAALPAYDQNGTMLYVQWLCLFRCWMKMKGRLI